MGFMDQNAGGGGPPLMRWNGQEGKYLKYDSELEFNDECFVLNLAGAVAGYLKFRGKGETPERHTGPIYPRDEAPERASLGDTDQSEWPIGRFSNEPEDPWTPVIELPLKHKDQDGYRCCQGLVLAALESTGWARSGDQARRRHHADEVRQAEEAGLLACGAGAACERLWCSQQQAPQ